MRERNAIGYAALALTTATPTDPSKPRLARSVVDFMAIIFSIGSLALAWRLDRTWFELHLTQAFCAEDTRQLHRLAGARIALVACAPLMLFVIRPRLGRWVELSGPKASVASALRILVGIALALFVSAWILRTRHSAEPVIAPPSLPPVHFDPDFWWAGDASTTVTLRAGDREIPYSFNASGYRAASQSGEPDPDAPSILFAGESITEGVGVRWEEAYPAIVASDLHLQPVEAAVHGYGNDQIYWAMQKELAKLHRPIAVVTFLIPELLERDLDPTRARLSLDAGGNFVKLAPEPPTPKWWKDFPLRKIAHGLFPYHDDSPIRLARAIFAATAKEAKARGAYPLFVMANWNAPCLPPESGDPSLAQRLFEGLDVPFILVTIDPNAMEKSTHHPRPSVHRVLAKAIEQALVDAKVATK